MAFRFEKGDRVRTEVHSRRKSKHQDRLHAREVIVSDTVLASTWSDAIKFPVRRWQQLCREQLENRMNEIRDPALKAGVRFNVAGFEPRYKRTETGEYEGHLNVGVLLVAQRAKDIPDEDEALDAVNIQRVHECIRAAFDQTVDELREEQDRERRAQLATQVVHHLADEVRKRAKAKVRYEQRLAALKAEYEAEQQAQIDEVLAEVQGDSEPFKTADGEPIDQRAIDAAIAKLGEALQASDSPFRAEGVRIKPEDVE